MYLLSTTLWRRANTQEHQLVERRRKKSIKSQARSQDFAKGGTFLRGENNSKRTLPKFSSVLNRIEAIILSKSGDLKKKVFTRLETVFPAEIR